MKSGSFRTLKKALKFIRSIVEYSLSNPPKGNRVTLLWLVIFLMLALCSALLLDASFDTPFDFFFAPILVACLCFRRRGLWIIIPALVLYHVCYLFHNLPLWRLLTLDFFALFKWLIVAVFTLITVERVKADREQQMRIERDIDMARTLQMALIPSNYDFGRVRIQGIMRQCQTIGGDFYYFRPFQEKYVVFCLGDVMGKGIPASVVMAIIMGFFFEWGKKSPSPAMVMSKLNMRLLRLWGKETTWFTTLFYAVFNEETGRLTYASGGCEMAVLIRADGSISSLTSEGLPVGAFEEGDWEEKSVELAGGDKVLLFTDGLTEARNADGELFSYERLMALLQANARSEAKVILNEAEKAVTAFTGGNYTDDIALLVMEVKPDGVWSPCRERVKNAFNSGETKALPAKDYSELA